MMTLHWLDKTSNFASPVFILSVWISKYNCRLGCNLKLTHNKITMKNFGKKNLPDEIP